MLAVVDDIVTELRDAVVRDVDPWDVTLYTRAADEVVRLRAAGDALERVIESEPRLLLLDAFDSALRAWEKVRRG